MLARDCRRDTQHNWKQKPARAQERVAYIHRDLFWKPYSLQDNSTAHYNKLEK